MTRLTNGYSKKVENLAAAVALHFMHYNFSRPHMSLGRNRTPAMAAGISDHVWTAEEIAALLDLGGPGYYTAWRSEGNTGSSATRK